MNDKPGYRDQGGVRIEISRRVLAHMLDRKVISISDIRCLDTKSKQCVWQACLEASIRD